MVALLVLLILASLVFIALYWNPYRTSARR